MTSDERLDQIVSILADVVRTQERIIFQIDKILDYVADTRKQVEIVIQRLNRLEVKVDLLEERTNKMADDIAILKEGQARMEARQDEMQQDVKAIFRLLQERLK